MHVLGTDVKEFSESLVEETGIKRVGRDELLDRSDVVSLNCALTEEAEGMIGEEELRRLGGGEGGYLINTARGELIDQDALVTALRDKSIAGAALDVFEQEPLPAEDPLTDLDSVILGSHNAQNTHKAVERTHERAVENLISCLVNEK
jgi:phosphoglycerate dehydrogenase-like enzyme